MKPTLWLAVLGMALPVSATASPADLYGELPPLQARPGLAGVTAPGIADVAVDASGSGPGSASPVSPALAGVLSAVLPGAGQLAQGQNRGWLYLGLEAAAWFSFFALRGAGTQAEEDFEEYALQHWAWDRYETVTECGPDLGPIDFDTERTALRDLFENAPDDFFEDIGRLEVYACGWDDQTNRSVYRGMRDDSDRLFRGARWMSTVAFLNHVVSAVDAAKSAAGRRTAVSPRLGIRALPTRSGHVALRVGISGSFR